MNDNEMLDTVTGSEAVQNASDIPQKKPRTRKNTASQQNKNKTDSLPAEEAKDAEKTDAKDLEEKAVESDSNAEAMEEHIDEAGSALPDAEEESKDTADPEIEDSEETDTTSSPLFTISADGFLELNEKTQLNAPIQSTEAVVDFKKDSDDAEPIPSPDELFAVRDESQKESQSETVFSENEAEDNSEEVPEEAVYTNPSEDTGEEENIDENGQYVLPDLERLKDSEQKDSEENNPVSYDPKKPRRIDSRFDLAELFVFTLLAVMIITSFFFRHSIVRGESMENTLHDGEHLIISDFFYTPKRGDVIVCEDHTAKVSSPIVKRVIALGGDHIRITQTAVYVNGKMLDETEYVYIDSYIRPYYYEPLEMTVPEGEIFVMGDHRNDSTDSRDLANLGTISEDSVLGKVLLRFYPFDKFGTVD